MAGQTHSLADKAAILLSSSGKYDVFAGDNILMQSFKPPKTFGKKYRKRRKRGSVRQWLRKLTKKKRLSLPSVVLANVQSLKNKTDKLQTCVSSVHKFRDVCVMAFAETWLMDTDPDSILNIDGFGVPIHLDRDSRVTGKHHGGGVCMYINPDWWNSVTVHEQIRLPDIELLSVSVRPFYLPREFPQIFLTVVYIHPRADANTATDVIFSVLQRLQSWIAKELKNLLREKRLFLEAGIKLLMLELEK